MKNLSHGTRARTASLLCALTLAPTAVRAATVFTEGFEDGPGRSSPYRNTAPKATVTVESGDAAQGAKFLRAACPGATRLEGVRIEAKGISDFRLYNASAQVRGRGHAWLCLLSANGWLYAKETTTLTDRWQEVRLSKLTGKNESVLGINILTRDTEAAVFEIDAVSVSEEQPPWSTDSAVGPVRIEAEDYPLGPRYAVGDADGLGSKVVQASIYTGLHSVPFPLTSRGAFVYLRQKPGTAQDTYDLSAKIDGYGHRLATLVAAETSGWSWLRAEIPDPSSARGSIDLTLRQHKRGLPPALLDSAVIATNPDLTADELAATPLLHTGRPLVSAGPVDDAPTIDGRLDDPCWRQTVAIRDFTLVGRSETPTQRTEARLCRDAQYLYIAFRCDEYVLQPAANQLHAFAHNVVEQDADVWRDDSVVILIEPRPGGPVYDVFCNAKGTVSDARCSPPDLWATRDKTWNGNVRAAGTVEDGHWSAELAIPLASLGPLPPRRGERWRLCLGRIQKNAKETSAWNPVSTGFHQGETLGTLLFGENACGVSSEIPARFTGGPNTVQVACGNGQTAVLASVAWTQSTAGTKRSHAVVTPTSTANLPFDVADSGRITLACDLLDAASLQPLYLSPLLLREVKVADAKVRVYADARYVLYANDTRAAAGASANGAGELTIPLQTGTNAFSIQTEDGRAAITIELPNGRVVSDGSWRFAPGEPAGFTAPALNDSGWQRAAVHGPAPAPLAEAGAKVIGGDGPGVLRRVVWFEKTYVWPAPDPAQYVPQNAAQHLTFSAAGMEGRSLSDFALHLAVPPAFDVIGATGYYGRSREEKAEFVLDGTEDGLWQGAKVRVHTIRATQPIPYRPKVRILELFNVFVRYRGPDTPDDEYEFTYWTEAEDGCITECPQSFAVRVSPPLHGKQTREQVWQLWGSFFSSMDDPAMKREAMATMKAAGFNNVVSGARDDTEMGKAFGITNTMGINFEPWSLDRRGYIEANPEHAQLDASGKRSTTYVCTTALLGTGWSDVAAKLTDKIKESQAHIVDWDYESSPFTSYLSCYCPACLHAFREHAQLSEDVKIAPSAIREELAPQWIDFMTTRNAQLGRKFRDIANAQGAKFSMYSGYQSEETCRIYGVDWAKIGRLQAADHIGCGYGRRREEIDATVAALDGIPLVLGALMRPYDRNLRERVVPLNKARVLRRLVDSTGGALIYDRLPLGGRSWFALAESSRLAAEHEELFLRGESRPELIEAPGAGEPELATRCLHGRAMVLLLNPALKEKRFALRLNAELVRTAQLFYRGADLAPGTESEIHLPPGEAEAIVCVLRGE